MAQGRNTEWLHNGGTIQSVAEYALYVTDQYTRRRDISEAEAILSVQHYLEMENSNGEYGPERRGDGLAVYVEISVPITLPRSKPSSPMNLFQLSVRLPKQSKAIHHGDKNFTIRVYKALS